MRRREFIAGLGAATWPVMARGQQPALPVIGYLSSGSQGISGERLRMFFRGLSEAGLSEGKNIAIEYRWAEGQYDRLFFEGYGSGGSAGRRRGRSWRGRVASSVDVRPNPSYETGAG